MKHLDTIFVHFKALFKMLFKNVRLAKKYNIRNAYSHILPFYTIFLTSCFNGRMFHTKGSKSTGSRNICVGFADVTRIRRESDAYVTQMLRAKFAYDVRHYAKGPREHASSQKKVFL
jgi:hypothetical protein